MRIASEDRLLEMSVGELAGFHLGPREFFPVGMSGLWRAQQGQTWHRELRDRLSATAEAVDYSFECPLQARLCVRQWTVLLAGRVDQIRRQSSQLLVREVKTIQDALPCAEEELRHRYPEYFLQIGLYRAMLLVLPEWEADRLEAELLFVGMHDGMMQAVRFDPADEDRLARHLDSVVGFFEQRRHHKRRLLEMTWRPPFTGWRDGQELAQQALAYYAKRQKLLLFEAPTGFGKTGLALLHALQGLKEGLFERVIYLTGKSTGQMPVTGCLEQMASDGQVIYYRLRNRSEHFIASILHTCDLRGGCRRGIEDRWARAGLDPVGLLSSGTVALERVRALGEQTGVCPWEITRALLPYADFWIADYNYLFGPRQAAFLATLPGFDPAQTLLVIDEAHNLPERAAMAWSMEATAEKAGLLLQNLAWSQSCAPMRLAWEAYERWLRGLEPVERLPLEEVYRWKDLLETCANAVQGAPLDPASIHEDLWGQLWEPMELLQLLDREGLEMLPWVDDSGVVHATCLSAAPEIASVLHSYGQCLLMSATLSPLDSFNISCGLAAGEGAVIEAEAGWRQGAYAVAVDRRVDTRLRHRARYYEETARTILHLVAAGPIPVAVFFPSYRYAEEVFLRLRYFDPACEPVLQPRGLDLAGQIEFLETALNRYPVLGLVLGGSFGEGIDLLGGRVRRAMVVGPALPEANAAQQARMQNRAHRPRQDSFREVYLLPALRRVNQALGRLVRGPGQKAAILLHCRRYAEPEYQALLAADYRGGPILRHDEDLFRWLENTAAMLH